MHDHGIIIKPCAVKSLIITADHDFVRRYAVFVPNAGRKILLYARWVLIRNVLNDLQINKKNRVHV